MDHSCKGSPKFSIPDPKSVPSLDWLPGGGNESVHQRGLSTGWAYSMVFENQW